MILRGLTTAANGMQTLIEQNDSTANNIANVNTIGYKKQALMFKNIYDSSIVQKSPLTEEIRNLGELSIGSQVEKLTYDFTQGNLERTENVFDLAIQGDGFFKIQSSDGGYAYTRNGSFTLNNNGILVTKDGDAVIDDKGKPIKIKTNDVSLRSMNDIIINEDGQIAISNDLDQIVLQKVGIYDFQNKEDMICIGGSQFKPTAENTSKEVKAVKFSIQQGSLEMSNANIVNEMIRTVSTSRNYETLAKVVKTSSDSLSQAMRVARL